MNKTTNESFSNVDTKYDVSCIIVLFIVSCGVIGNFLTLFALLYAKHKKKHDIHKSWKSNYVFIWNLTLVDFIGSINMLYIYIQLVFNPLALNDQYSCIAVLTIRDVLVLVEAGAIACIAIMRMLGITKNVTWLNFCDNTANVFLVLLITWLCGCIAFVRKFISISDSLHNSLNDDNFDCGNFFYLMNSSRFTLYFEFCAHILVFIIIIGSYIGIAAYMRKNSEISSSRHFTQNNDSKTTKIIFGVCAVYIVQCVPYMIARGFFVSSMRKGFFIQFSTEFRVCYILYYTQFSLNMLIYPLGKSEFYKAYIDLFQQLYRCFVNMMRSENDRVCTPAVSRKSSNEIDV
jgi:hypothetical protein